jgi:hypothetical protein
MGGSFDGSPRLRRSANLGLALCASLLLASCGGSDSGDPPPTAAISATPTTIKSGGTSTLTWSSMHATSCTGSGAWSGNLAASGTRSVGPLSTNATYSVRCSGAHSSSSPASVTIDIVPTAALSANPTAVPSGGSSELTWSSTNASSCTASGGWTGALATSGSQSVGPLSSSTTYSLSCTGAGGTSMPATLTINVNAAPTATLTASPTLVASGGSATLTWSSSGATSCTASGGWNGNEPTTGSESTGAITSTTSYTLICSGPGGTSNTAQASVTPGTLTLSPSIAALTLSQTQQYTATVPVGSVNWSVDGVAGGNSTVGVVSSAGLYTPGTAAGTHTVTAASTANPAFTASAVAAVTDLAGVYTYHDDLARDGVNAQEYALTTSNVSTTSFGKLFSCTVDGAVYAQPLWVAGLTVNGTPHNVVFVATEHDGLFAFDADASPCVTLWSVSLIDGNHGANSGETTVPAGPTGYLVGGGSGDITPEVGVTGTPVIDPARGILYVVSKSVSANQATFYQRLHAINVLTGAEEAGSPALITATYPGTGDGGTTVSFSPRQENQRSGLSLVNGIVYLAWASHEDTAPYYGWVIGYSYNGSSLAQTAVYNATPNAQYGGIWMSGGAPAADENNNLYVITGNGKFDATSTTAPSNDYGDSLLELSSALTLSQYFTPSDQATDDAGDADFGSGGTAILADLPGEPIQHLILGGGKDGSLYVLNRDTLGGLGDSAAVQKVSVGHPIFMTGAYWNQYFFLAGLNGPLSAYQLNPAVPSFASAGASSNTFGFPGSSPSVSATGTTDGIVWALNTSAYCTNQSRSCGPAILYAYDALNVSSELWDSSKESGDAAGNAVKFAVPTIANGKVYVGTRGNNTGGAYGTTSVSGELDVYGLKPQQLTASSHSSSPRTRTANLVRKPVTLAAAHR